MRYVYTKYADTRTHPKRRKSWKEWTESSNVQTVKSCAKTKEYAKLRRKKIDPGQEKRRTRAYAELRRKLIAGDISKKKCEFKRCGSDHSTPIYITYEPLYVRWVCKRHHLEGRDYYLKAHRDIMEHEAKRGEGPANTF